MCDCLSIGCYDVMVFIGEVHISRTKTSQYVLYKPKRWIWCAMFDEDLARRINNRRTVDWLVGWLPTRGWPKGETVGPCKEWHDTIWTSSGKYFSNVIFSEAFTEVCPETMASTGVAERRIKIMISCKWTAISRMTGVTHRDCTVQPHDRWIRLRRHTWWNRMSEIRDDHRKELLSWVHLITKEMWDILKHIK
jgi:hypothetical protein